MKPLSLKACPECGYDLRGTLTDAPCPECGFQLADQASSLELYWTPPVESKPQTHAARFRNPSAVLVLAFMSLFVGAVIAGVSSAVYDSDAPVPVVVIGGVFLGCGLLIVTAGLVFAGFAMMSWLVHGFSKPMPDVGNLTSATKGGASLRFFYGTIGWWVAIILVLFLLFEAIG